MEHWWNGPDGTTDVLGETPSPGPTLPITNTTCTSLGLNPGVRCERSTTNRLFHGIAQESAGRGANPWPLN